MACRYQKVSKGRLVKSPYKPISAVPSIVFNSCNCVYFQRVPLCVPFILAFVCLFFQKTGDKNTLRWYDFEITGNQNPDKTRWRLSETSDSRIPVSTGFFWLRNWLPANREICLKAPKNSARNCYKEQASKVDPIGIFFQKKMAGFNANFNGGDR